MEFHLHHKEWVAQIPCRTFSQQLVPKTLMGRRRHLRPTLPKCTRIAVPQWKSSWLFRNPFRQTHLPWNRMTKVWVTLKLVNNRWILRIRLCLPALTSSCGFTRTQINWCNFWSPKTLLITWCKSRTIHLQSCRAPSRLAYLTNLGWTTWSMQPTVSIRSKALFGSPSHKAAQFRAAMLLLNAGKIIISHATQELPIQLRNKTIISKELSKMFNLQLMILICLLNR